MEAEGFAGDAHAYFTKAEIEAFAAKLRAFPLDGKVSLSGGIGSGAHIALAAYPVDGLGHIGVHVSLDTPAVLAVRPESRKTASMELLTTYGDLERFSHALDAVLHGSADEAVLTGE